jgi:hypothetical protein
MSDETEGTAQSPASDADVGASRAPKAKAKKTTAKKATTKTAAKKTAPKKKTSSKTASKQTTTKKAAAKKPTTKKSSAEDGETAKKPAAKKSTAKKIAAKKSTTKKAAPASKKTTSKKSASTRPTAKKQATKKTAKSVSEAAIKELTDDSFGMDDVQAGLSLLLDKAGSFMGKGNLATILAQLLVPKRSTGITLFPDAQPEEPPALPSSDEVAEVAAALPPDLPDEQARAVQAALAWLAAGAPQAESSD